jgi:hypothetical protein
MPTRDEDWQRFIEGDDPSDPLQPLMRRAADAWHLFEAFVGMDSATEAHNAIALADEATAKRALLAAAIARVGLGNPPAAREWLNRSATPDELLTLFEFGTTEA